MAFAVAGLAFAALIGLQIIVWRFRAGRGDYVALAGLATFVFVWMTLVALNLGSLLDWANAALLYGALALAYMVTYSALQGDSPTFAILRMVAFCGERGATVNELAGFFDDRRLIMPRLADLVYGGLAVCSARTMPVRAGVVAVESARYHLTSRGAMLARLYLAYRRLLRLEKGG